MFVVGIDSELSGGNLIECINTCVEMADKIIVITGITMGQERVLRFIDKGLESFLTEDDRTVELATKQHPNVIGVRSRRWPSKDRKQTAFLHLIKPDDDLLLLTPFEKLNLGQAKRAFQHIGKDSVGSLKTKILFRDLLNKTYAAKDVQTRLYRRIPNTRLFRGDIVCASQTEAIDIPVINTKVKLVNTELCYNKTWDQDFIRIISNILSVGANNKSDIELKNDIGNFIKNVENFSIMDLMADTDHELYNESK